MVKSNVNKSVFEKVLAIFAWLFFVIAIITALLSVFSSLSSEKNGKEIFGVKFLIVASDSMSKSAISNANKDESVFFDAGDIVIIKTAKDGTEYKVGDVISFVSRNPDSYGKTLTHKIRTVNYAPNGNVISYTTYGINTGVNDRAVVSPDTIIGSYSGKIPKVGNILSYLKTPAGYYLSILTPSVLLIIFFSINVGKYFGRKEAIREQMSSQTVAYSSQEFSDLLERVEVLENKLQASGVPIEITEEMNPNVIEEVVATEGKESQDDQDGLVINGKKVSFTQKLLGLENQVQDYFNNIHNEIISHKKVKERVSFKQVSYRKGRTLLAKMTIRGKTLKLHLALDTEAFNKNVFFQKDMSSVKAYSEVPFTVKVKSTRGEKNAVKLVDALMEQNGLIKKDGYIKVDAISLLKKDWLLETEQPNDVVEETSTNDIQAKLVINAKKISFAERLLKLDTSVQQYFNTIHNEVISYKKINDRVSLKGVSYRMGRKLVAKMTIRGKTLKLHLALDVNAFNKNVFFQKDMSTVKAYSEVPFTVKVKSPRAEKNAVKLISALMDDTGAIKNPKYNDINKLEMLKTNKNIGEKQ